MSDAPGALRTALAELARRLKLELALSSADLWDGAWHALKDPGRISLATPAALVSATGFEVSRQAMSRYLPGQLRGATAGDPPDVFPRPGQFEGGTRGDAMRFPSAELHLRPDIAVTFVSAAPGSAERAGAVLDLAERALPVLVGFSLRELSGSSLYTPALAERGLACFVVVGHRDVDGTPAPPPRQPPEQVDLVEGAAGARETLYTREAT